MDREYIKNLVKKSGILKKRNVIGYSNVPQPKIQSGLKTRKQAIRIYVTKKEKPELISKNDLVPRILCSGNAYEETDIIELGNVRALSELPRTAKARPVTLGLAVGHQNITAGSLGQLYHDKDGNLVAGSNAHIVSDHPDYTPDKIQGNILQPASYFGGTVPNDIIGTYKWHKTLTPSISESTCPVGKGAAKFFNVFPKVLGRRGRFSYVNLDTANLIDFGVYEPTVEHLNKVDNDFMKESDKFIGHLFAGSDNSGIICKVEHVLAEGYTPLMAYDTVKEDDTVYGSSFWGDYMTTVDDSSASLLVGYGDFTALFDDVIIVFNAGVIKGGWSGSGFVKRV